MDKPRIKQPEELGKDRLLSLAMVMHDIKEAYDNTTEVNEAQALEFWPYNTNEYFWARDNLLLDNYADENSLNKKLVLKERLDSLEYLDHLHAVVATNPYDGQVLHGLDFTTYLSQERPILLVQVPSEFFNLYVKVMKLADKYVSTNKLKRTNSTNSANNPLPKIEFKLGSDFAVHENNIISYRGREIPLEAQVAKLVIYIMKRSHTNSYTPSNLLTETILANNYDYEEPEKYVVKMVSEARRIFKSATGTAIDYFPNKRGFGYIFRY